MNYDVPPDGTTGGNDKENNRKWQDDDGAVCFYNHLLREQTYSCVILIVKLCFFSTLAEYQKSF